MNRKQVAKELVKMAREVNGTYMPSHEIKSLYAWNHGKDMRFRVLTKMVNDLADELQGGVDEGNTNATRRDVHTLFVKAQELASELKDLQNILDILSDNINRRGVS